MGFPERISYDYRRATIPVKLKYYLVADDYYRYDGIRKPFGETMHDYDLSLRLANSFENSDLFRSIKENIAAKTGINVVVENISAVGAMYKNTDIEEGWRRYYIRDLQ